MRIVTLLTIVCILVDPRHAQINNCGLDKFRCHNGECIQGELLCDGTAHCRDLSDETEEECKRSEILCPDYAFRCKYGACVNGDAVCNGVKDCIDNSDETLLRCANNPTKMPVTVRCNRNEFACDNGQCIDSIDVCDGTRNCADGSDEVFEKCGSITCNPTVFRCAYGACINGNLRCNGVADCADGSDEDPSICGATRWPSSNPTSPTPPSVTPLVTPSTPRSCKAPPQPPNGFWKLHRLQCDSGRECDVAEGVELQLGSHLIYSCNPGYKIRGTTDVICSLGGNWLNKPVCLEIRCQALSSVSTNADCTYNGNWVSCGSQVLPGTSAKLTCRNSYRPETNLFLRDNVRCDENGQWDPQPMRCIPECGILPGAPVTPLIVHGTRPNITEFPWHATMYRDFPGEPMKQFCGASIIQENLLITAAHCVYEEETRRIINPRKIHILTGNVYRDYNFFHDTRVVRKGQVKNIYITCNYLGFSGNYIWDIAILELVEPFELSATLVPVCLDPFTYNDQTVLEAGSYGKVAGFGRTETGESSGILQSLTVPFIPFNQCRSASQIAQTEQYITIDKFCAGYTNGSSVCDGDSGGGLIFKTGGLWYLRGIVSVSLGTRLEGGSPHCDPNSYSLYTRVSSHIAWIQDIISKLERKIDPSCSDRA